MQNPEHGGFDGQRGVALLPPDGVSLRARASTGHNTALAEGRRRTIGGAWPMRRFCRTEGRWCSSGSCQRALPSCRRTGQRRVRVRLCRANRRNEIDGRSEPAARECAPAPAAIRCLRGSVVVNLQRTGFHPQDGGMPDPASGNSLGQRWRCASAARFHGTAGRRLYPHQAPLPGAHWN